VADLHHRPATGNTFDAYKQAAKTAKTPSTSPPDGLPFGGQRLLKVDVGLGGNLTFTPNNITELPRTTVQFSFNPKVSGEGPPSDQHLIG
jgi:hypothetical protein